MTPYQSDPERQSARTDPSWTENELGRPYKNLYSPRVKELAAIAVNLTRLVQSSVDGLMYVGPDRTVQQVDDALEILHELQLTLAEDFDGQTT